jgi:flagellar biosynthetic protein FliP
MSTAEVTHTTQSTQSRHTTHHGAGRRPFLRHYLEMMVAMLAGMVVVGGALRGTLALAGTGMPDQPEVLALEMAATMAIGMAAWMRLRGHGWPGTLEMAGSMFVPLPVLLPLVWAGAIGGDDLLMLEHVVMLPVMYLVMRRRRSEYGG